MSKRFIIIAASVVGVLVTIALLVRVVAGLFDQYYVFKRFLSEIIWDRHLFPNSFNLFGAGALFILILLVVAIVLTVVFWTIDSRARHGLLGASVVLTLVFGYVAFWENPEDGAHAYSQGNTTFVVDDLDQRPTSLRRLFDRTTIAPNGDGCDLRGPDPISVCINEGDFNQNWEKRTVSYVGAELNLIRTTDSDNYSTLMQESLTYIYDHDDSTEGGSWTALRDGSNHLQFMVGVMEWSGIGRTNSCSFAGDYELLRTWRGWNGRSLSDDIAQLYPDLIFAKDDIWSYCEDVPDSDVRQPVIVIPAVEQEGYDNRTTTRPAGLIVIKGSPNGEPDITLDTQADPGEYAGPVYPINLAKRQRGQIDWLAGRWSAIIGFGYSPSEVISQDGNASEFLLKSRDDGRLYWVTPMKPAGTDSERIVAYSLIPADTMAEGQLNEMTIYVNGGEDVGINAGESETVDLQRMYTSAYNRLNEVVPAYFAAGTESEDDSSSSASGRLVEFLPVSDTMWRVYAERSGEVTHHIDVPIDVSITPTVVSLSSSASDEAEEDVTSEPNIDDGQTDGCNTPATLSEQELAACLSDIADELSRRSVTIPTE